MLRIVPLGERHIFFKLNSEHWVMVMVMEWSQGKAYQSLFVRQE